MTFRFEGEYAEFERLLHRSESSELERLNDELEQLRSVIALKEKYVTECTEEINDARNRLKEFRRLLEEKDAGLKAKDDQIAQLMRRLGQA